MSGRKQLSEHSLNPKLDPGEQTAISIRHAYAALLDWRSHYGGAAYRDPIGVLAGVMESLWQIEFSPEAITIADAYDFGPKLRKSTRKL